MRVVTRTNRHIRALITDEGNVFGLPKHLQESVGEMNRELIDVIKPDYTLYEITDPPSILAPDCPLISTVAMLSGSDGARITASDGTTFELSQKEFATLFG